MTRIRPREGKRPVTAGRQMHALIARLFPIGRSLTGNGVRETLRILRDVIPLEVPEIRTGTRVFDWTVPKEWNVRAAFIRDSRGRKVVDFADNNLHLVGYSIPFNGRLPLSELKRHLHSLPGQPDVIPYVTSYFEPRWGFCIPHRTLERLRNGIYEVVVDTKLKQGSLTYADLVIPGTSDREVLISTYICHPSMANNELSGPAVAAYLARHVLGTKSRRLTYRFVFAPETLGALVYLKRHLAHLKRKVVAGYVLTSTGDRGGMSYLTSRAGDSLADRAALHVLQRRGRGYKIFDFRHRGSQERQFGPAGVDLPVGCLMRSRPADYVEYHTSADNLDFVTPAALPLQKWHMWRSVDRYGAGAGRVYYAAVSGRLNFLSVSMATFLTHLG